MLVKKGLKVSHYRCERIKADNKYGHVIIVLRISRNFQKI